MYLLFNTAEHNSWQCDNSSTESSPSYSKNLIAQFLLHHSYIRYFISPSVSLVL